MPAAQVRAIFLSTYIIYVKQTYNIHHSIVCVAILENTHLTLGFPCFDFWAFHWSSQHICISQQKAAVLYSYEEAQSTCYFQDRQPCLHHIHLVVWHQVHESCWEISSEVPVVFQVRQCSLLRNKWPMSGQYQPPLDLRVQDHLVVLLFGACWVLLCQQWITREKQQRLLQCMRKGGGSPN